MDRDLWFLLVGAGIALVSGIIGSLIQHFLSLRADKIKRERDGEEEERESLRRDLTRGVDFGQSAAFAEGMMEDTGFIISSESGMVIGGIEKPSPEEGPEEPSPEEEPEEPG